MLRFSNTFALELSINGVTDFIKEVQDLFEFSISEYSGCRLPTFNISFISDNDNILKFLNEGNIILASYGKDIDTLETTSLVLSTLNTSKEGDTRRMYAISGFAINLGYIQNNNLVISSKKSGIEVAIEVAKRNFKKIDSNITKSEDSQYWIQPNTTDRHFINHLIMRSDLKDSFACGAILANGVFILRDIKKLIKDEVKWKFIKHANNKNEIDYSPDASLQLSPIYYNFWTGYEKGQVVIDFETGEQSTVSSKFIPILAISKEQDKDPSITKKYDETSFQNDSVHANFFKSYKQNLTYLTQLSKVEIQVDFQNFYRAIKPLDLCFFAQPDNTNPAGSNEFTSGVYIATRVTKSIQNKKLITTVLLNREALNSARNA